jgi:hypothetical protein
MGALCVLPAACGFRTIESIMFAAAATIVLLAPGGLYQVAAYSVRQRQMASASLSSRVAVGQIAIAIAGTAAGVVGNILSDKSSWRLFGYWFMKATRNRSYDYIFLLLLNLHAPVAPMYFPSLLATFFVPALLAQMRNIRSAIAAIRALPEQRRGFEAIPMATLAPQEDLARDDLARDDLARGGLAAGNDLDPRDPQSRPTSSRP